MRTFLKDHPIVPSGLPLRARFVAVGLAVALAFGLIGDRNVRSAIDTGQDPLDVLNLQAKPNAYIILDTSGSMGETFSNQALPQDHPDSKMSTAKSVLKEVVQENQKVVRFSLASYSQPALVVGGLTVSGGTVVTPPTSGTYLPCRFTYVTTDAAAAGLSAITGTGGLGADGLLHNYNGCADTTYFSNWVSSYGGTTYYAVKTNRFINGETIRVTSTGAHCAAESSVGSPTNPATVTVQQTSGGCSAGIARTATFTFYGVGNNDWIYPKAMPGSDMSEDGVNPRAKYMGDYCDGSKQLVGLADCGTTEQLDITGGGGIGPYLEPALLTNSDGSIQGYVQEATSPWAVTSQPTQGGIRADGNTPIANSLWDLRAEWDALWATISAQKYKAASFAIVVTDGDDTCHSKSYYDDPTPLHPGDDRPAWATADARALRAAYRAQDLYWAHDNGSPSSHFRTFVIGLSLGNASSQARANYIAYGGSGMKLTTATEAGDTEGSSTRWSAVPTAADFAACKTCVGAYTANTKKELKDALVAALNQGLAEGEFADRAIVETVFEYGPSLDPVPDPPVAPLNPTTRYSTTVPILYQSSWTLPDFEGHLSAIQTMSNDTAQVRWDAATILKLRHAAALAAAGGGMTFAQLHASATVDTIGSSAAGIKRRIFTTSQNGINTAYTPINLVSNATALAWTRVTLWPPLTRALDGTLDVAMGIDATQYATFALLKSTFGGCAAVTGYSWPGGHKCNSSSQQLAEARLEARQMILAFMAGAKPIIAEGTNIPSRDASGNVLYTIRGNLMSDATASAPAVVVPPPDGYAQRHSAEYRLFINGVRESGTGTAVNALAAGFGLRNPDEDGAADMAAENDKELKPVMSVVYHPANDMLHAFRAGPCPATTCTDTGGEELWGFVPFDQLSKLRDRFLKIPTRKDHVFMVAAPARFADVFVEGAFNTTIGGTVVAGTGVWRTILYITRGQGGKSLTALDVTMPGPTTHGALTSSPPTVVFNRGNPDTIDGLTSGAHVDATSYNAYLNMGETWSTPAVVEVDKAKMTGGKETVLFLGSGYSDNTSNMAEGRVFYVLDALTGTVLQSFDVGNGGGSIRNAIVSAPGAFQPEVLTFSKQGPPMAASSLATAVYFNDVHGRIFRYDPTSPASAPVVIADRGALQPFGASMVLANTNSDDTSVKPHVYAASGNDIRVADDSGTPFEMVGLRDVGTTPSEVVFTEPFENDPVSFRGTTAPAGAFKEDGTLVVYFVGTRFLDLAHGGSTTNPCVSEFQSVIYILEGRSGNAAYDIPGTSDDKKVQLSGEKITGIQAQGGAVYISRGLTAQASLPPKKLEGAAPRLVKNITVGPPEGARADSYETAIKLGSSVCIQ